MTKAEREKAIDLLNNLRGMIEDNQGNDYDFALKKGAEALKHEQGSDEMTVEEYRQRLMQVFLDTNCDELIALCVLPTEKDFEHLKWLLKNHYKKEEPCEKWLLKNYYKKEPCEDAISKASVFEILGNLMSIPYDFDRPINKDDVSESMDEIRVLPPVTPTSKVGKWVFTKTIFDKYGYTVECSSCCKKWKTYDEIRWKKENKFCPNCGNKKESEE